MFCTFLELVFNCLIVHGYLLSAFTTTTKATLVPNCIHKTRDTSGDNSINSSNSIITFSLSILKFYDQVTFEIIFKRLILSKPFEASRYVRSQGGASIGTRLPSLENLIQFYLDVFFFIIIEGFFLYVGGGGLFFLLLIFFYLCKDVGLLHPYEAFLLYMGEFFLKGGLFPLFLHAGVFYHIRGDISWELVPFYLANIFAGTHTSAGTHAWLLCIMFKVDTLFVCPNGLRNCITIQKKMQKLVEMFALNQTQIVDHA